MNSIEFNVHPTQSRHQRFAKKDYLIVINSKTKELLNIGDFAVVKHLYINPSENEALTLSSFGRVLVDDNIACETLCLSQTLRQAIGIPVAISNKNNIKIKLERLNLGLVREKIKLLGSSQYIILRVQKSIPQDIEKNFCRMSPDSISIVGSKSGQKLIFETCFSDLTEKVKDILIHNETVNLLQIEHRLANFKLDEKFYCLVPNLIKISEEPELFSLIKCASENKHFKSDILNLVEIITWQISHDWRLHKKSLTVFETNSNVDIISQSQSHQRKVSLFERYPDFKNFFNTENDLDTVYLDAYSRSLLKADLLQSVRVRRDLINIIKNEIVEFGVVFVITIFTTIDAINGDNIRFLPFSIGIAIFYLLAIILIRGK